MICWYKNRSKYFEIKDKYRDYFRKMQKDYSDTKFYKQAIEECKYFNAFVNKN